jgi:hypothetical protein
MLTTISLSHRSTKPPSTSKWTRIVTPSGPSGVANVWLAPTRCRASAPWGGSYGLCPRGEGFSLYVWGRSPRFRSWCRDIVTFREVAMESGPNAPYCLRRMQPSESCPFRPSWLRRQSEDENDTPAPVGGIPVDSLALIASRSAVYPLSRPQ